MPVNLTAKRTGMFIIAILAWFGLGLQLYIMHRNVVASGGSTSTALINFISYFTILSNLMVAISFTLALLVPSTRAGRFCSNPVTQSAIGLYIVIVGITYSVALRKTWDPQGWQLVADRVLHDVVPILYFLWWILFIPGRVLHWKQGLSWLLFPLIYLVYSLLRGAALGWYPYPFLHAGNLGYGEVAVNSLLILAAFLIIGSLMIVFNRYIRGKA